MTPAKFTHAIILDFEATCDDRQPLRPQEVIEFPSVLLRLDPDFNAEVVAEFESFVRPIHHPMLTSFCRELTSIRQVDVDEAESFNDVFQAHSKWLDSHNVSAQNTLIVTCGDWDLGTMLPAQCIATEPPIAHLSPIYRRWQNIKVPFCAAMKREKAPGMAGMLSALDLPLLGRHHRGIDDCRNIARLYSELLKLGAKPEITSVLSQSKYPPISIRLRFDDQVETVTLAPRSISSLRGIAGRTFKRQISKFYRTGRHEIVEDCDLNDLLPNEEVIGFDS